MWLSEVSWLRRLCGCDERESGQGYWEEGRSNSVPEANLYPGGLKEIKYKDMMSKKPDEVRRPYIVLAVALDRDDSQIIRKAVSGMLPKNKLRERRLERLRIFEDQDMGIFQKNILKRWEDGTLNSTPPSWDIIPVAETCSLHHSDPWYMSRYLDHPRTQLFPNFPKSSTPRMSTIFSSERVVVSFIFTIWSDLFSLHLLLNLLSRPSLL